MSKNIKANILEQIKKQQLTMRPSWVFWLGSALSALGVLLTTTLALLSIQLLQFRLTHPGVGASRKLSILLSTIPWYIPFITVFSLFGGYLLLKRYDFSYRKNFTFILALILTALIIGSYALSQLGINEFFARRGYFRQIYNQSEQILMPVERQGRGIGRGRLN